MIEHPACVFTMLDIYIYTVYTPRVVYRRYIYIQHRIRRLTRCVRFQSTSLLYYSMARLMFCSEGVHRPLLFLQPTSP
jgi:hypothetical protein